MPSARVYRDGLDEVDDQGFVTRRRHDSWVRTPRTPEEIEQDRAEAEAYMRAVAKARGLG